MRLSSFKTIPCGRALRSLGPRRWPRRRRVAWSLGLFVLAFAVRSLYAVDLAPLLESQEQPGMRMMQRYDEGAAAILRGEGVIFVAPRDPGDTGLLSRPPGYSLFLAAIYRTLGRGFFLVQLVQNLLSAACVVLVFGLAGPLVGWRAAAVAGVLASLAPPLAYFSSLLTPDVICTLPILAGLLLLAPAARGRRVTFLRALLGGVLFGAAVWLRPNLLLLGPFVAVALLVARGRRARTAALALTLGAVLAVAPITLRNWVLYRAFIPVSINLGIVLWEGLADASGNQWGTRPTDIEVAAREAQEYGDPRYADWWASPDGIRRDRDRVRRSLAIIRERPIWFAGACLVRMRQMLTYVGVAPSVAPRDSVDESRLDALVEPGRGRGAARRFGDELPGLEPVLSGRRAIAVGRALGVLRPVLRPVQSAIAWSALPLVVTGVLVLLALVPARAAFLLVTPVYQLLFQSIVHLEFRYTAPMQHLLLVAAGVTVVAVADALARRRASRTMAG